MEKSAALALVVDGRIETISDFAEVARNGILLTPVIIIFHSGDLPKEGDLARWLQR